MTATLTQNLDVCVLYPQLKRRLIQYLKEKYTMGVLHKVATLLSPQLKEKFSKRLGFERPVVTEYLIKLCDEIEMETEQPNL